MTQPRPLTSTAPHTTTPKNWADALRLHVATITATCYWWAGGAQGRTSSSRSPAAVMRGEERGVFLISRLSLRLQFNGACKPQDEAPLRDCQQQRRCKA